MSRKGENIYKRKDGRWEARYVREHDADGHAKFGYCYGKTYREVKEKVTKIKADIMAGIEPQSDGRTRFGVFCKEWLSINRMRIKDSTYVKYETAVRKHILPSLGGCPVSSLSNAMVGNFGKELLYEKELSSKSAHDILTVLHSILVYTQSQVPGMRNITVVYPKNEKTEMRVLSREEQRQLTEYLLADMDECKFGVLLALLTGLRIGELCALRWRDISAEERCLTVSSTMQRLRDCDDHPSSKTKVVLSDPKSSMSIRVIPLTDYAVELCEKWRVDDPDAFILSGVSGKYVEPRTLQYRFNKYVKACGLSDVNFHALRHTFATRCIEVGFEIKSLSEILGHTNPSFTLSRYVHSSLELKRNNMNKLTAIGC